MKSIKTQKSQIEKLEDLGLSILLKKADRSKKVSRAVVMKKLEK